MFVKLDTFVESSVCVYTLAYSLNWFASHLIIFIMVCKIRKLFAPSNL